MVFGTDTGPGRTSAGPHEDVLLLAERELDDPVRRQFSRAYRLALVIDGCIIDANGATLHMTACLAIRGGKACADDQAQQADPAFEFGGRNVDRRQVFGERSFLEGLARSFRRLAGGL